MDFSFKGDRNYVHGSDIYMKIMEEMKALDYDNWDSLGLNITQICHHNLICSLSEKRINQKDEVVNFVLKKGNDKIFGSLVEDTSKTIESRYAFNENDIFKYCTIDSEKGSIEYNNPQNTFLTIEIILAIAKLYLEKEVDNTVKWYFRRITLFKPMEAIESHPISITKISQKNGFIGFDLFVGNEQFGDGYAAAIPESYFLK